MLLSVCKSSCGLTTWSVICQIKRIGPYYTTRALGGQPGGLQFEFPPGRTHSGRVWLYARLFPARMINAHWLIVVYWNKLCHFSQALRYDELETPGLCTKPIFTTGHHSHRVPKHKTAIGHSLTHIYLRRTPSREILRGSSPFPKALRHMSEAHRRLGSVDRHLTRHSVGRKTVWQIPGFWERTRRLPSPKLCNLSTI